MPGPSAGEIAARGCPITPPIMTRLPPKSAGFETGTRASCCTTATRSALIVPRLFDGELPVFNIGTNGGASCAPEVEAIVTNACADAEPDGYSYVVNGRFRGGWITRHYGDPENGVHAVQMELAQARLPDRGSAALEPRPGQGRQLRAVLKPMLHRLSFWATRA